LLADTYADVTVGGSEEYTPDEFVSITERIDGMDEEQQGLLNSIVASKMYPTQHEGLGELASCCLGIMHRESSYAED
jgi:hypothetical protein